MGLEKSEGRKIFLSISDGRIVRQHQNPIEGTTVTRENKNKRMVHEEFFKAVTGMITDIKSKEAPFGPVWEITVSDGEEEFVLSFTYSGKYTNHFFRALPNVDLSDAVTFNPWSMKDKKDPSKTAIGLSLWQGEKGKKVKVEFAYTREEPGEMPELKKKKVKGKDVWDDSERLEFFEKMLVNKILPQLKGNSGKPPVVEPADVAEDEAPF